MNYCFLDLETTGFDPQEDSIIEISFLVDDDQKKTLKSLDQVISPHKSLLTPKITQITGITQEEIDQKGIPFDYIRDQVIEKLKDTIIVGHNIGFDRDFLIQNEVPVQDFPFIDTHQIARIVLPQEESYSLEYLAQKYGFHHRSAHRAMSDVEANRELFYFLGEQIENLPQKFLEKVRPLLENQTWYARHLFLNASGKEKVSRPTSLKSPPPQSLLPDLKDYPLENLSPEKSLFLPHQKITEDLAHQEALHKYFLNKNEKILIVTPFLEYFPQYKPVPLPQILLDPVRLETLADQDEILPEETLVFYLKCQMRHTLGYRGKNDFDLFFKERELWEKVCIQTQDHPTFEKILRERESENVLVLTPYAFFALQNLPLLQTRIQCIHESEIYAEKLLFSASKTFSLGSYLNHPDQKISIATQFWISHACKDIIQPHIRREISHFPEKVLLDASDIYPLLADRLDEIGNDETLKELKKLLKTPSSSDTVRWAYYAPESGHFSLGVWNRNDWLLAQKNLQKARTIFFYRHTLSESKTFFRLFIGKHEGTEISPPKTSFPDLEIPSDLVSNKSPEFNTSTADFIKNYANEYVNENHSIAVHFSSLESLKKVHEKLFDFFQDQDLDILGEKVQGGTGKLLQKIENSTQTVLLEQKITHPALLQKPFKTLIFQKFPFSAPHPLLSHIDKNLSLKNLSFWDLWTIPQVSANISRKISQYPRLEHILWLDPRHNTPWGKEILKNVFKG